MWGWTAGERGFYKFTVCPADVRSCTTRLSYAGDVMVRKGNYVQEHHYVFADSTFFKAFTVRMLAGDPNTALNEPNSLVIDESTARKYFDESNARGNGLADMVGRPWNWKTTPSASAILITLVTVSFQTIRAALANPVKSLHSE